MKHVKSGVREYSVQIDRVPPSVVSVVHDCIEVGRHEIALRPDQYFQIFHRCHGRNDQYAPWNKGIVKVCVLNSRPMYLRFRGSSRLKSGQAALNAWTADRLQLLAGNERTDEALVIQCKPARRWVGTFWHFWEHTDDAARVSFKLGVLGIGLGLIAFIMDWTRWYLTSPCP